eukprot:TRINITY_DN4329_c0_g1_i6.p1 TRINITY_DN4329_c0_g1~~TRINITY_DN4329_c0_g1_i6.p1  ORF type:complete len:1962 (+),score=79.74 TRINITY_DN4329_c0_g1_i6:70-5886(+)
MGKAPRLFIVPLALELRAATGAPTALPTLSQPPGNPPTGFPSSGYPSTGFPSSGYPSTGFPSSLYPASAPTGHPVYPSSAPTGHPVYPSSAPTGHPVYPASGNLSSSGYPSTGYPSTGYPSTGYPSTGFPSTGFPSSGYPSAGLPSGSPASAPPGSPVPHPTRPPSTPSSTGPPTRAPPGLTNFPTGRPAVSATPTASPGNPSTGFPSSGYPSTGFPPSEAPTGNPASAAPSESPTGVPTTRPTRPPGPPTSSPAPADHCRTSPGGALLISGLTEQQANGVYLRDDAKAIHGNETYWLHSGLLFVYSCFSRWLIVDASTYAEPDLLSACVSVAEASAFPTDSTAQWTAAKHAQDSAPVLAQPAARAECIGTCTVQDGSAPSLSYPCTCGLAACVGIQRCNASTSTCSECAEIRVAGLDQAVRIAARKRPPKKGIPSPPVTALMGLDGRWKRDNCRRINGKETYWHSSWYLYRCVYNRWSIADNATRDWRNQDVQRDCLSVARSLASEQDTQPLGISRWEVWDGREWLRPEHDSWHEVFTCPATQYEPPCASAGPRPPPPTATPAAPLPAPWPAFSMADCATSRGGFEVGGKAQWRPCTPRNVAVFGGKRLWACLEGLVLCNGDPDSNNPTRCEALRDFGCDRGVYDVAYHPDRGTVLLACRNGIISCNADANASAAAAVSDCVTVDTAPCPTGSIALGLAIPPRHPGLLVVGCWTEFAADEGVMLCPLGPAGALGDCVRKGVSPCGQPGRALLSGLSFDSSGGLIVGCQEDGYAYCTFGVSTGPSSCSRAVLGTSPCPLSTTGITQLAAGKIAAGCGAAGVRICRAGAALQPTREPTQTPTQPVAATWAPQSPGQPTALPAPGAPTHRPTVPVTWEPTTPLTTHAELPCHTIPGGALLLSGLATHRANGVYVRQDTKVIRARTTYWLRSGLLFLYSCSSKWFIASGSLYEEIPQMTSCPHVVEASTYPTLAAARWTAVTPQGDSDRQLEARAQCITSCDVSNGTGPATVYPCTCGTTWCSSAQWCSAATSNCSDCTEIRVAGFDTAVARAAPRKSKLAADSLGLDGLWRRDDCKRISGWETYWHNDGITYLYRCAYQRWAIADNLRRRWDKQDDHADCWSIARSLASEQDAQPLGISRWEVWDGQRFFSLEHDSWHTVLTCPNTSYVPPCFPGLPPPAAPPSAAGLQPVPDPLFGLTDCASTAGGSMLVNGSLRWHPCRPSVGVAAYEGKRLWVCPAMAVLCDGDFDSASPAVCTELGDLGCEEIFDAAFHPDGRRVFLACGGGVRSCEFDASANATSAVSHCENVTETTCPPGSTVGGVAVAPGDGRALVLGCHTGFSADEGVLICPMSPDWTQLAEGCKRKGVSPCGAAGFSTLGGLNFDTVGGLIGGCRRNGYAYCSFSIDSGPSSCSMSALGISPCPADGGTNAIAQFPSGRVAAACRWAGTKTCNGTALAVGLPSCDAASCTSAVTITTGLPSAVIGEPPYRQRRNDLVRGCEVRITSGLLGGDRLGLPLSYQSTYGVDAHWDGTALTIVPSLATVCSPWHCSCQGMSDYYGVRYSVSWGCSTWAAQSWWTGHKCRTNPGDGLADFPGCASTPAASTVMMPVEQCGTLLHRVTLTSSSSGTRTLRWGLLMPDGVVFHGGHYFRYFTQGKSWMQAAEACQNITMLGYKGYLATVTSRSEHQFLVGLNAAHVPPTQQWPHAWLGGADNETEGEWTWQTGCEKDEVFWRNGTSLTFTHWPEWEPNSFMGDEDGLVLDGRNTMWNDGHLDRVRAYICEFGGDCPSVGRPVVPLYGTVTVTVRTVSCHNGPAPGTAPPTPDVDFSSCSRLVSGQTCTPNYHCAIGYHSPRSSFILNCDQSATYNASAASPVGATAATAPARNSPARSPAALRCGSGGLLCVLREPHRGQLHSCMPQGGLQPDRHILARLLRSRSRIGY